MQIKVNNCNVLHFSAPFHAVFIAHSLDNCCRYFRRGKVNIDFHNFYNKVLLAALPIILEIPDYNPLARYIFAPIYTFWSKFNLLAQGTATLNLP